MAIEVVMDLTLKLPDIGMTEAEIRLELANTLFRQNKLTLSQASELAGQTGPEFERRLGIHRSPSRPATRQRQDEYGVPELEEDLRTLKDVAKPTTIISSADQVHAFAEVFQLDLPRSVFGKTILPEVIFDALCAESPYAEQLQYTFPIEKPKSLSAVENLDIRLAQGATHAFALALENAGLLLADEPRPRAIAAQLGIPRIGFLAVLLEGKRRGQLKALKPILDKVRPPLPEDLYARMHLEAGE